MGYVNFYKRRVQDVDLEVYFDQKSLSISVHKFFFLEGFTQIPFWSHLIVWSLLHKLCLIRLLVLIPENLNKILRKTFFLGSKIEKEVTKLKDTFTVNVVE